MLGTVGVKVRLVSSEAVKFADEVSSFVGTFIDSLSCSYAHALFNKSLFLIGTQTAVARSH